MQFCSFIFAAVSVFVNWLPFCMIMDISNQLFFADSRNQNNATDIQSLKSTLYIGIRVVPIYILFMLACKYKQYCISECMTRKINKLLQSSTKDNTPNANRNENLLLKICLLFPDTTRILKAQQILIIGTSHFSAWSAYQVQQILEIIHPSKIVLELDELRANHLLMIKSKYDDRIIRDLLTKWQIYCDPVTLLIRIGNRCMSYFVKPGEEFKVALEYGRKNGRHKHTEIILGDEDCRDTMESIKKNTPLFMRLIILLVIVGGYAVPLVMSFINVFIIDFMIIGKCNSIYIILRLFAASLVWILITSTVKSMLELIIEQSKHTSNGLMITLAVGGKLLLPCLAKILQKSNLKKKRDHTLIKNTLLAAESASGITVAVVGLAHMTAMFEIANTGKSNVKYM